MVYSDSFVGMLLPPIARLSTDEEMIDKRLQRLNLTGSSICWVHVLDDLGLMSSPSVPVDTSVSSSQGNEEVYDDSLVSDSFQVIYVDDVFFDVVDDITLDPYYG